MISFSPTSRPIACSGEVPLRRELLQRPELRVREGCAEASVKHAQDGDFHLGTQAQIPALMKGGFDVRR